jgi:hypothetical protein
MVAVVSVLLIAPQSTEFWSKVGLLASLTIMCAVRPILGRWRTPERGSADDRLGRYVRSLVTGSGRAAVPARAVRVGMMGAALLIAGAGVVAAGIPARGVPAADTADVLGRVPHDVDPATMPKISVEQGVLDWNHELSGEGAQAVVLTLVENLELENQAMLRSDATILPVVDHGDRLDAMRQRLQDAEASGTTVIHRYQIDGVNVSLLVPFGRQDGLSLGLESHGTATTETFGRSGRLEARTSAPFSTTFVVRRATGGRWLNVAELPPKSGT